MDVRYAFRMLRRSPAFTAVAVIALALGIGANTALFTVLNTVLLRPLPFRDAGRICQLRRWYPSGGSGTSISGTKFLYWKQNNRVFDKVAAYDVLGTGFNLSGEGEPERIRGFRVSEGFFEVLGLTPLAGRSFTAEEDRPGAERVCIISEGLWRRRFGADPGIVGRRLTLGGEGFTVAGVMPSFQFHLAADVWTPIRFQMSPTDRPNLVFVIARLKSGVTEAAARTDLAEVAKRFRSEYPNLIDKNESAGLVPFREFIVGDVRRPLWILLGAVALVLLIACANVANLLLARASARSKEVAIRTALGAGRGRVVRQLLTESAILAMAGGVLGVLLAVWGLRVLVALAPAGIPRLAEVSVDTPVLAFTFLVSLATGVLFGAVPALESSRGDVAGTLKSAGGRSDTAAAGRGRWRSALVVSEVALALVLLIGAGLLIESFLRIRGLKSGFDPRNVLTMQMSLSPAKYATTAQTDAFVRQVLRRIETLPAVEVAAAAVSLPLEVGPDMPISIQGRPDPEGSLGIGNVLWRSISPAYFRALKIPLLGGRYFTESDSGGSPRVAIINESMAKRYWPNENPIGKQIEIGRRLGPELAEGYREIVGVVGDVREAGLDLPLPDCAWVPQSQVTDALTALANRVLPLAFVVRTGIDPMALRDAIRREALGVDFQQPVSNFRTMEDIVSASTAQRGFNVTLLGVFAAIALLLAAVGIYGVMAYSVEQRTHEIGIRMALGAERSKMLSMILWRGLALAATGVAVGLAGAFALTRLMTTMLFGVKPAEPIVFAGLSLLLLAVAGLACLIPALRATRVDPLVALRYE